MSTTSTRPIDNETMPPPPAKRVKSDEASTPTVNSIESVPVSPEKEETVSSIMRKRTHDSISPTQDSSSPKKLKESIDSPTTTSSDPNVDPNVFASAFALASLALSPTQNHQGAPYAANSSTTIQQREDDALRSTGSNGDYTLREPSSPGNSNGGMAAVPPSPEQGMNISEAAMRRRRVKFASRMSMRSIPARGGGYNMHQYHQQPPHQQPYDRMGVANRMIMRHGPVFRHAPYPKRPAFPFAGHAPVAPPWNVPGAGAIPHHQHHPAHGMPPPPPPPPQATPKQESDWICDYCHVASFKTYEEACAHESTCRLTHSTTQARDDYHHATHGSNMALYDHHRIEHDASNEEAPVPVIDDPSNYFDGVIALAVPSADSEWLSELNCYIRSECVEAFSATVEDLSRASKRGRIVQCQVGIRCKFCVDRDSKDKAVAAVSYPTTVSGIYESVKRWQRVHQSVCQDIPSEVRERLEVLQNTSVWVPTTRQYWADSARALGMTDTHHGIRFERPPSVPEDWVPSNHTEPSSALTEPAEVTESAGQEAGFIALPCDKDDIPEYVYFLMRQVESCRFSEADRFVARSKGPVGFPGFQCRYCNGHAGLGKYYPVSAKSLATNSTSQNIHAHLLKCRKCPPHIKETLVRLKTEKGKSPRLVPGWRREFFDRIWFRMHGTPAVH